MRSLLSRFKISENSWSKFLKIAKHREKSSFLSVLKFLTMAKNREISSILFPVKVVKIAKNREISCIPSTVNSSCLKLGKIAQNREINIFPTPVKLWKWPKMEQYVQSFLSQIPVKFVKIAKKSRDKLLTFCCQICVNSQKSGYNTSSLLTVLNFVKIVKNRAISWTFSGLNVVKMSKNWEKSSFLFLLNLLKITKNQETWSFLSGLKF